jgi:hypothetical protein
VLRVLALSAAPHSAGAVEDDEAGAGGALIKGSNVLRHLGSHCRG